ncbi:hypothetical protein LCGC14_1369260 [marine sediment metagenome]|uniref:Uncharacterized protein n=1 Tax=marine sediment metagenome TaxID=412755 RepID=A0A0F9KRR7_9ZZZZ
MRPEGSMTISKAYFPALPPGSKYGRDVNVPKDIRLVSVLDLDSYMPRLRPRKVIGRSRAHCPDQHVN